MKRTTLKKCYIAFIVIILMHSGLYALSEYSNFEECESETAFAFLNDDNDSLTADDASTCFIPQFNRWGWTTFLDFSEENGQTSYVLDIYSGAGQCDLSKGNDVGSVTVTYNEDSTITFEYNLEGYLLSEAHIYVGSDPYPTNNSGSETVAPGQYTFTASDFGEVNTYSTTIPVEGSKFYVIIHGVTQAEDCPDENCEDSDEDGVCDTDDICPDFDDTIDSDGDGIPDGCDDDECIDSDGDSVCDTSDICPGHDDTIDTDGDGIPDGCDTVAYSTETFKTYPVPFKNEVNVLYSFNYDTFVNIEVFDTKGIKLAEFRNNNYEQRSAGNTKLDLSRTSSQLLFIRLSTVKSQFTKKIVSSNTRLNNN